MDLPYQTPHKALQSWAYSDPNSCAFKVQDQHDATVWRNVSSLEHFLAINKLAVYYTRKLKEMGIAPGAIVSLWVSGMRYDHLVHAIALSRAGYTPHLCSFSIASIDMLFYVVPKVGSWAIFYDGLDPTLAAAMVRATKFPVPVGTLVDPFAIHIPNWEDEALVSLNRPPRDLGFILHTTSSDGQGLGPAHQHAPPAPVEITFSDLHAAVSKELRSNAEYGHQLSSTSDIVLMSYGCAQLQGLHCINTASFLRRCIVIPSRPPRPSELAGLIRAQSINRLILSSSALQPFFREAQSNEAIVRAFRQLRQIRVHGTDIPSECVNWMLERTVPLVILGAR